MDSADFRPMISSFKSPWISAVSIKGGTKPFENLLSVKHYLDTPVYTPTDDLEIGADLSAFVAKDDYPLPSNGDREGYNEDYHYDWWSQRAA